MTYNPFQDRKDLSSFGVHLCKPYGGQSAAQNLSSILDATTLEAKSDLGMLCKYQHFKGRLMACCFTEAPLNFLHSLIGNYPKKKNQYEKYGIAFFLKCLRKKGANPIWYVNYYENEFSVAAQAINSMLKTALANPSEDLLKVSVFIDKRMKQHD